MTYRYRFISTHRAVYGVKRLCRVLAVRRQGFYEWLAAAAARQQRAAAEDGSRRTPISTPSTAARTGPPG